VATKAGRTAGLPPDRRRVRRAAIRTRDRPESGVVTGGSGMGPPITVPLRRVHLSPRARPGARPEGGPRPIGGGLRGSARPAWCAAFADMSWAGRTNVASREGVSALTGRRGVGPTAGLAAHAAPGDAGLSAGLLHRARGRPRRRETHRSSALLSPSVDGGSALDGRQDAALQLLPCTRARPSARMHLETRVQRGYKRRGRRSRTRRPGPSGPDVGLALWARRPK
jgi:hypothetical protein